jgi:CubicO group peptidase (beta-lactamase class C family)
MNAAMLLALMALAIPGARDSSGWPETTPEKAGLDAAALDAFDRELASGAHGYVDSMLVIRHGRVAYEKEYDHSRDYARLFAGKGAPGIYNYYDPGWHPFYRATRLHTMQSVSKSVTSALVGIAIGRGEISGVDARVMALLSEWRVPPDPRRDRMTLRDVLTMTTGIRWDEESTDYTDPRNNCAVMESKDDWIRYVLEQPMAEEPGKTFVYNSGATELLSGIIQKATGKTADDYAKEHLFGPLGIEYYWKRTPKGLADTEGGLYLKPRDLAKLGDVYMHDGVWRGKRVLPAGWAAESTQPRVAAEGKYRYGYQWWVMPESSASTSGEKVFFAWGYGGQFLFVVPRLELIAVFTGWNIYDKPELDPQLALSRVLKAIAVPAAR